MNRSIWSHPGLIYAAVVALMVAVSLIARMTGILPLRETEVRAPQISPHETKLPLDHVRGWNPPATEFPPRQQHDQVDSLPYPWKRS
ncbi:MAG: hypothetical protein ACLPSF_13575 [Methylocella sp.]